MAVPRPGEEGLQQGEKTKFFDSALLYSQRAVFVSPLSTFSFSNDVLYKLTLTLTSFHTWQANRIEKFVQPRRHRPQFHALLVRKKTVVEVKQVDVCPRYCTVHLYSTEFVHSIVHSTAHLTNVTIKAAYQETNTAYQQGQELGRVSE